MANTHVELDFLGLHNLPYSVSPRPQPQPQPKPRLDRRESFRGISKINPEIVKSVIASAGKHSVAENGAKWTSPPVSPRVELTQLPVIQSLAVSGASSMEKASETAPLTIFYDGKVSVFDMSKDEAEYIMKLALDKNNNIYMNDEQIVDHSSSFNSAGTTDDILKPLSDEDGDMPLKRKISLQRFFEKRKERLMSVAPYPLMDTHVSSIQQKMMKA